MAATASLKEAKIQIRLQSAQKDLIARAAQLKQTTLSGFMVDHAYSAAQQVLADQIHFAVPRAKWKEFCTALDARPREIPALRQFLTEPGYFDGKRKRH